jgi:hypothetical protein
MSARKLGRLAGLVFVLAALVGGTGAATASAGHGTGGSSNVASVSATQLGLIETIWG